MAQQKKQTKKTTKIRTFSWQKNNNNKKEPRTPRTGSWKRARPGENRMFGHPNLHKSPERCWLGCPSLGQEAHCPHLPRLSEVTVKHDTFLDVARRSERKKRRLQTSRPHEKCWQLSLTISRPSEDGCWSERQDGANGNVSVWSVWT